MGIRAIKRILECISLSLEETGAYGLGQGHRSSIISLRGTPVLTVLVTVTAEQKFRSQFARRFHHIEKSATADSYARALGFPLFRRSCD